jgi:hypothetical protein
MAFMALFTIKVVQADFIKHVINAIVATIPGVYRFK